MTQENDIVLIYFEDNPLVFARIEDIQADVKADWFQVKLLLLQVPIQTVTWILRDVYINGEEFTMNGKRMRMERVVSPDAAESGTPPDGEETPSKSSPSGDGKVIDLSQRKKS